MSGLKALNLAIRFFVVELGALAAAAYWGFDATDGAAQVWLAVAAPAADLRRLRSSSSCSGSWLWGSRRQGRSGSVSPTAPSRS